METWRCLLKNSATTPAHLNFLAPAPTYNEKCRRINRLQNDIRSNLHDGYSPPRSPFLGPTSITPTPSPTPSALNSFSVILNELPKVETRPGRYINNTSNRMRACTFTFAFTFSGLATSLSQKRKAKRISSRLERVTKTTPIGGEKREGEDFYQ